MKRNKKQEPALLYRTTARVRFSEVDAMNVVWHGSYVHFLEDGREAFGREYGIGYFDILNEGYVVPIVDLNLQYKHSILYGEVITIETRYIPTSAAKILFEYIIYKEDGVTIAATGSSMQVFVDRNTNQLELNTPAFYKAWKEKWNIL
ncbi:acyl-CoA thioesterase [Parabacteroides sp. OttesenSCG-928-G06]|nr:acyl-CoA thioesterase [Parabacteroides sp. OttesenSCG-928-K15]MDL2282833.1 acyl-CoA thioesterase [Parabacteroides sp. OttesenSCG-928-G06]